MFDIAVCCDDIPRLEHLCALLEEFRQTRPGQSIRVSRFQSLYDLVTEVQAEGCHHLYLLDHRYEFWMNHLSPEAVLRREDPAGLIVSLVSDHAAAFTQPVASDPLRLSARLPKPLDSCQLTQVLERLVRGEPESLSKRAARPLPPSRVLSFPTPDGVRQLPFDSIVRLSYDDHVVTCCLAGGEEVRGSTQRPAFYWVVWPLTKENSFSQVSAAQLINMDYLEEVDTRRGVLRLAGGWEVVIPKTSLPYFQEQYESYRRRISPQPASGTDDPSVLPAGKKRSPGRPRKT